MSSNESDIAKKLDIFCNKNARNANNNITKSIPAEEYLLQEVLT